MARHTQQAIEAMQEALDRARIADAAEIGALKTALCLAVFRDELATTPLVLPSWDRGDPDEKRDEHIAWIDDRLAVIRTWLRPYWDSFEDRPRDDVWAAVESHASVFGAEEAVV